MAREMNINLRIEEALVKRLDRWRGKREVPPTRPEAIRQILDHTFDVEEEAEAKRKQRRTA